MLQRLLPSMLRLSFWVWQNSLHAKQANSTMQLCVLLLMQTEMADLTLTQCRFSHNIANISIAIWEWNCLLAMQWLQPNANVRGQPPSKKVRWLEPPHFGPPFLMPMTKTLKTSQVTLIFQWNVPCNQIASSSALFFHDLSNLVIIWESLQCLNNNVNPLNTHQNVPQ